MRDYFEAEMRLLHEAAREFAEAYPEQARMLNLSEIRDRDPYIERLLEGMAFLTAHVRERIDESRSAISEQLLAQLCPSQVRPYPAATIVELRPQGWRQAQQSVPAGALVYSPRVGDAHVRCPFALTRGLRLHPLELREVTAVETESGRTRLQVELRAHGSTPIARMGLRHLDFFIHADRGLAVSLYALVTDPAANVRVANDDRSDGNYRGAPTFRPVGLSDEGRILPASRTGQLGLDLLQDYFCFRDRYLFVRLDDLDRIDLDGIGDRLYLEIDSPVRLPPGHQLGRDNLRLFCVPAVNLWPMDAEPVALDHRRSDYRLVADARYPQEISVYAVDGVTARDQRSDEVTELSPLHRLRSSEPRRYFHATRHGHGAAIPQTYLQVGGGTHSRPETLSARILACNGHLPRRHLNEGDINEPGDDLPSGLRIANITRPSPCYPPPGPADHPTRLHGFLTASAGSLADAGTLASLLELMDWSERADNRRRIDAIIGLGARPVNRLQGGILQRGLALAGELDESGFASVDDMRLFGDVLHAYFASVAAMNEFVSLSVTTQPMRRELTWQPRTGRSSPL